MLSTDFWYSSLTCKIHCLIDGRQNIKKTSILLRSFKNYFLVLHTPPCCQLTGSSRGHKAGRDVCLQSCRVCELAHCSWPVHAKCMNPGTHCKAAEQKGNEGTRLREGRWRSRIKFCSYDCQAFESKKSVKCKRKQTNWQSTEWGEGGRGENVCRWIQSVPGPACQPVLLVTGAPAWHAPSLFQLWLTLLSVSFQFLWSAGVNCALVGSFFTILLL